MANQDYINRHYWPCSLWNFISDTNACCGLNAMRRRMAPPMLAETPTKWQS